MTIINKIAFLVHEPTMYAHYGKVWSAMDSARFTVVLLDRSRFEGLEAVLGAADFLRKIRHYDSVYFADLVAEGVRYQYVVSNHPIGGSSSLPTGATRGKGVRASAGPMSIPDRGARGASVVAHDVPRIDHRQYLPLQIGDFQIRFMYGADINDSWSLQNWNEIYDLFLCHGPNDQEQLAKRFKGRTAIMGYPRYDDYFLKELDAGPIIEEFDLDPNKPTILWMSTLGPGASSIPRYAEAISGLLSDYNVIARPHPVAFRDEPENIELLRRCALKVDADVTRDMNRLYKVADWVLCDNGGSPFGVVYLGINLLLLHVPGSESQFTVADSSNLELCSDFPVVTEPDTDRIHRVLQDEGVWEEQAAVRARVCGKYFADLKGSSSSTLVRILEDLVESREIDGSSMLRPDS